MLNIHFQTHTLRKRLVNRLIGEQVLNINFQTHTLRKRHIFLTDNSGAVVF